MITQMLNLKDLIFLFYQFTIMNLIKTIGKEDLFLKQFCSSMSGISTPFIINMFPDLIQTLLHILLHTLLTYFLHIFCFMEKSTVVTLFEKISKPPNMFYFPFKCFLCFYSL